MEAFNSDVLAVRKLIGGLDIGTAIVVGLGGAGRAAFDACLSSGLKTSVLRHDQVGDDIIEADLIIYTLPKAVPGIENIHCRYLLEANYLTPVCTELPRVDHYISGKQWLKAQAILGYGLMTGEQPDAEAIQRVNF